MIHSGSRGLGYQVCDDSLERAGRSPAASTASSCPTGSSPARRSTVPEGQAVPRRRWRARPTTPGPTASADGALGPRASSSGCFGAGAGTLGMNLVYDVAHNIAKIESTRGRRPRRRRSASTARARRGPSRPGHPDVPERVPRHRPAGDHPRRHGTRTRSCWWAPSGRWRETFGTTCHGAGRVMSRHAAPSASGGGERRRAAGAAGHHRPRPQAGRRWPRSSREAYKDVAQVVDVVHEAGISRKVARMRPIGVVKG